MEAVKKRAPDIRYLKDIKKVLYDKKWFLKANPETELYYMYRGVKKKNGLRYDITVIPPRNLGKEFVKTLGHTHLNDLSELYIVLEGKAIYLMQNYKNEKIKDVYAVFAKKGEAVIIPQGYGHITINANKKDLKEANWLNEKCKNIYDVFLKKEGAAYYYTNKGWIKNKNYGEIPKLRFEKPLKKIPKNLNFLK